MVLDVLHLTNVLHSATGNAIPNHKNLRTGRAKMKGKALWNEEIGQASKHAKTAFHHWKTEGALKDNNNKSYNDMNASKKVLRQIQRQASSKIRESKYDSIMESAEFNQQLFYKLIREQRPTGQTDTGIIVIDDMILNTDEMILNDWNAHFERLGTPDISHHNNMDYSELECELIEQIIIDLKKHRKLLDITTVEVKKLSAN